jgi:hypothetical protein
VTSTPRLHRRCGITLVGGPATLDLLRHELADVPVPAERGGAVQSGVVGGGPVQGGAFSFEFGERRSG